MLALLVELMIPEGVVLVRAETSGAIVVAIEGLEEIAVEIAEATVVSEETVEVIEDLVGIVEEIVVATVGLVVIAVVIAAETVDSEEIVVEIVVETADSVVIAVVIAEEIEVAVTELAVDDRMTLLTILDLLASSGTPHLVDVEATVVGTVVEGTVAASVAAEEGTAEIEGATEVVTEEEETGAATGVASPAPMEAVATAPTCLCPLLLALPWTRAGSPQLLLPLDLPLPSCAPPRRRSRRQPRPPRS